MPSRAERIAWEIFARKMKENQPQLDGTVPVALITLPVCRAHHNHPHAEDGAVDIDIEGSVNLLWPPGLTAEHRIEIVERAARELRAGRIT